MNAREVLEGQLEAERVCALIMATSRTPEEARSRMRNLLFRLIMRLNLN